MIVVVVVVVVIIWVVVVGFSACAIGLTASAA